MILERVIVETLRHHFAHVEFGEVFQSMEVGLLLRAVSDRRERFIVPLLATAMKCVGVKFAHLN